MRKSALFLALLSLAAVGCTTTSDTSNVCVSVVPDGGVDDVFVCDVAWSCNADANHYELQCSFSGGNYQCRCLAEGVLQKNFTVSPFSCEPAIAIPAAVAGCSWNITLE